MSVTRTQLIGGVVAGLGVAQLSMPVMVQVYLAGTVIVVGLTIFVLKDVGCQARINNLARYIERRVFGVKRDWRKVERRSSARGRRKDD